MWKDEKKRWSPVKERCVRCGNTETQDVFKRIPAGAVYKRSYSSSDTPVGRCTCTRLRVDMASDC